MVSPKVKLSAQYNLRLGLLGYLQLCNRLFIAHLALVVVELYAISTCCVLSLFLSVLFVVFFAIARCLRTHAAQEHALGTSSVLYQ